MEEELEQEFEKTPPEGPFTVTAMIKVLSILFVLALYLYIFLKILVLN